MFAIVFGMDTMAKLEILADAAKYDVACTSSGVDRRGKAGQLGAASAAGCCHAFTADGRCVTLLKVLLTNVCCYDCAYCVNRRSNDIPRAAFTPRELATLTVEFYRRNYIEGLFVSSGVVKDPDYTMELIIETARILREDEGFRGYIHAKAIQGASSELLERLGFLVDRMSINIELPSQSSLDLLAPEKSGQAVVRPMRQLHESIEQSKRDRKLARRRHLSTSVKSFVPAGQSTQMIIGATPETDQHILKLAESLYRSVSLKRVFFSAYLPVNDDSRLPELNTEVPLTREHRLYQADWLLRFYGFSADELLSPEHPDLDLLVDPKANWALQHMDLFPLDVNTASPQELMRVPGIGVRGAQRIVRARKCGRLGFDGLKRMGVSLKRAGYFITCFGHMAPGFDADPELARRSLEASTRATGAGRKGRRKLVEGQLALFDDVEQANVDPFRVKRGGDILLQRARAQRLEARPAELQELGRTPSGLPQFDPLLMPAVGRGGAHVQA